MMAFTEKYKGRIDSLRNFTLDSNFRACYNTTTDLIRTSEFADYPEGVFLGEILQSLFYFDIRSLIDDYEVTNEHIKKIQEIVIPIIEYIRANLPLNSKNKKSEFFNIIMNSRYALTKIQIEYWREKIPKEEYDQNIENDEE